MVEHLKVMAALTVEHAYASLSVEHLKVMAALTVEPATASSSIYLFGGGLMVEHLKVLISRAPKGPYGRAPKGDGGLISRACLRILISRAP